MLDATPKQQTVELIGQAKNILLVSHKNPDGDALGCLCALKIVLEKMGKKVFSAVPDKPSTIFAFLPKVNDIKTEIEASDNLVVTLDLKAAQIEKIGYKKDERKNKIDIIIVPRGGRFTPADIEAKPAGQQFDLIIAVDTPNFERLGKLAVPTDIFYEVPLINIDHHPSNERYGKVNWVELVATSTAEILVSLFEALKSEAQLMDKDVATALLAGLIYDTSSFQNINTTPKSLTIAAQLVAAGARQQEIVKNLYKTKSIETLKLWGTILSGVKEDKAHRFLYSAVTKDDIAKSGADESALSGIVDELLKSAADADLALLLSEREGYVHGSLRAIAKSCDVAQVAEVFGGGGHEQAAAFRLEGTLAEREGEILRKIRQSQSQPTVDKKEEGGGGDDTNKNEPEKHHHQPGGQDSDSSGEGGPLPVEEVIAPVDAPVDEITPKEETKW